MIKGCGRLSEVEREKKRESHFFSALHNCALRGLNFCMGLRGICRREGRDFRPPFGDRRWATYTYWHFTSVD